MSNTTPSRRDLNQRADYTFKFNNLSGRHGWLRLTPAYSLKVVEEILRTRDLRGVVLDPFSGTGTTGLSAAYHGHDAACVEINPFLVWFGRIKVAQYSSQEISQLRKNARIVCRGALLDASPTSPPPPIHNIERWWPASALRFLCNLKANINLVSLGATPVCDLLRVAFCRSLIKLSNAAFNHQSMSFKSSRQSDLLDEIEGGSQFSSIFLDDVEFVAASALANPVGACEIVEGDSRLLSSVLKARYDLVITSPPYPNRMSFIRELRPYMYWLGFLNDDSRAAGELDWRKIGGTWGIATSRLNEWEPNPTVYRPRYLELLLGEVAAKQNKSGRLLANYIAKYFEDIWLHLMELPKVLELGAEIHYIVGNSTFYGVLVPVERIYADMLSQLGFESVSVHALRKRNSKKELVEFDVTGSYARASVHA